MKNLLCRHNILGHCNFNVVKNILNQCNIACTSKSGFCDVCVQGKAHKLPFSSSTTVYTLPLQLIYIDIWGPAYMHATNGEKYYISFLDAYSKFTWFYLLHSKSQVLVAFKTFKLLAENQTGLTIKTIQTDNAKEFHCFKSFINESGIQHRFTCPHTHEQNGVVYALCGFSSYEFLE